MNTITHSALQVLATSLAKTCLMLGAAITLMLPQAASADTIASVLSPDSTNIVNVSLNAKGELRYNVWRGGKAVINDSKMGLRTSAVNFTQNLVFKSSEQREINEEFTLPTGKRHNYVNHCNEVTLNFKNRLRNFAVVIRAYNDGVALRYVIDGRGKYIVTADSTQVNFANFSKCWGQEYIKTYEGHYNGRTWKQVAALKGQKMCAPVLVQSLTGNDYWALVTESDVNGTFCASSILGDSLQTGHFRYGMDGSATVTLPFSSPWRTIFLGNLTTLVESTLNENLCPASTIDDTSWIKAGLSSWDWGGLDGQDAHDINYIKQCIDLASIEKWPYFTLDAGWDSSPYRLKDVTDYAASKGVKVFIWSHQNRFQTDKTHIKSILKKWKDLGFSGIKVDFFESDAQSMMLKYQYILEVAAEVKLMVNFHGATKPSGLRRTYPNLVSREGVYGGENYYWNGDVSAGHNVNLTLTRNVVGPMDYTPVEFATNAGVVRHKTTWSHQLALAVLYESGIQTMSESRDNIIYSVAAPMLKGLPASWDETKCIDAKPDSYVTIMRRSADDFYVASISSKSRSLSLPLSFLGNGEYTAQIYKDGICPSDIVYDEKTVNSTQRLTIAIKANGGCCVRFSKTPHEQPVHITVEAESGTRDNGLTLETDDGGNCSGGQYIGFLGNGNALTNKVEVDADGIYDITMFYITQDARDMYVQVNGGEKTIYSFPGNGYSWAGDGLAIKTVQVSLKKGENTIAFGNDNGYCPNLDRIVLSPSASYKDVKVMGIVLPKQATKNYTSTESVKAMFVNNYTSALKGVKVGYQIDYGDHVTDSIPIIATGDTVEFEFPEKADFSTPANHTLLVWVEPDSTRGILGDMASAKLTTLPSAEEKAVSWASEGGKVASYSYQESGTAATYLIDNDNSTAWSDGTNSEPWVQINLPREYKITRMMMRDCATNGSGKNIDHYTVYTKNANDSAWNQLLDTYNRENDTIKIDNFTPVNAQSVKIVTSLPADGSAVRLYCIDIYGDTTLVNAIERVTAGNAAIKPVNVYTLSGALVRRNVSAAEAAENLQKGIYIIGRKKTAVQ